MFDITTTYIQNKHHDLSIIWLISRTPHKFAFWTEHDDELKNIANDCMYYCTLLLHVHYILETTENNSNVYISSKNPMV